MTRINLLPWREIRRKENTARFHATLAVFIALTMGLLLAIQTGVTTLDHLQVRRNEYLSEARTRLATTAQQADELKQHIHETRILVDRLSALERFRSESVLIMHELADGTPTEIYLTELQQTRDKLTLTGLAQSEENVSRFLHAIEASPLLSRPELITLENTLQDNGRAYTRKFTLRFYAGSRNDQQVPTATGQPHAPATP